jgi:hypothetical protein
LSGTLSASLALPVFVRDAVCQPGPCVCQGGERELQPAGVAEADQPHPPTVWQVVPVWITNAMKKNDQTKPNKSKKIFLREAGLRIRRIHLIRIRIRIQIQHFRLNTDPDPGLNDQKLKKKITAEKKIKFFWIKNYNLPRPQ